MRIIAGKFRGKKLIEYFTEATRPTSDAIKENIFNVLGNITGMIVLDLFSGTGALGIEALSRGANEVVFVDSNRECVEIIKKNVASINQTCKVINADYLDALEVLGNKKFDLVFLDPPYKSDFGVKAIQKLKLNKGAVIVFEHSSEAQNEYNGFSVKTKKYGNKQIDFLFSN